MSVPAGTVILWPSIARLMSGTCHHRPDVAFVPQGVVLVLLAEVAKRGVDHPAGGIAETAEAAAVLQAVRTALKDVELDLRALRVQDQPIGPHMPNPAQPA